MPTIRTPLLDIAFETGGLADGAPVLLLHGWPDDATAWRGITPALEQAGYRWVAPWLRGFGQTRFLADDTPRDATGAALAQDALDLADALGWGRFSVIGHDWGGRTAYILAAIAPERLASIAALAIGYSPRGRFVTPPFEQSRRWWYQWFMCTDGGAERVHDDPLGFARVQWDSWGPTDWFNDDTFAAVAEAFRTPDWPTITLHGYRSRWMPQPLDSRYAPLRKRVDATEILQVPTLMVQGASDRCDPPEESAEQERYFAMGYQRIILEGVGHFPARERPAVVAAALCAHLDQHRG